MKRIILTVGAIALAASVAQGAKPKYIDQFKEGKPFALTPDQAYILYRSNVVAKLKSDVIFVRDLTPAEIELYNAAQLKAEQKQQARALSALNTRRLANGLKPLAALPPQPAAKPLPPAIPQIKDSVPNVVRALGAKPLIKGVVEQTYLLRVPAGMYLIAAQSPVGMVGGTCMCMGSVRFEAKPGQVTDLGTILAAPENAKVDVPEFRGLAFDPAIKVAPWNMTVRPAVAAMPKPPGLGSIPLVPATYIAADKFPNFLGMLVSRMPAVPGVLDYDGDRVITPPPAAAGS